MIFTMILFLGCPEPTFVDTSADTEATCTAFYRDADEDDHGDPASTPECLEMSALAGYATTADDCDDTNKEIKPGAPEICYDSVDNNCDGVIDEDCEEQILREDKDGDGYFAQDASASADDDCDDFDPDVNPAATELCGNAIDEDCNGVLDNDCEPPPVDADGDGYSPPDDCDDAKASVNPGATERCNGVDDDCDGGVDEGGVCTTPPVDADGDGYAATIDCDDSKSTVHPGATETCNGRDDDCDGTIDEGGVCGTPGTDADGDGYNAGTDCKDTDASIHPGATEACNGIDDNCDGQVDEGFIAKSWYKDADLDGYGDPTQKKSECNQPSGYVADSTDCDDSAPSVKPGGIEACNGIDDDCDGAIDEGAGQTWYRDLDVDGYGDSADKKTACSKPAGYTADGTDCDDSRKESNPGKAEVCWNGEDDDCDGSVDDGCVRTRHDFTVRAKVSALTSHGVTGEFWWYGRNKSTDTNTYWFAGYSPGQFLIGTAQINAAWSYYDSIPLYAYSGETWVFNGFCTGAGTGQCVDTNGRILGDTSLKVSDLIEIRGVSTPPTCTVEWGIYGGSNPGSYWDYHIECVFP